MRHLARALPLPVAVAVAMVVACMMALAAAAPGTTRQNHLPVGQSAYLDSAQRQRVDWYPWGKEAFRKARERNQPTLLDLGATWCPWCKLMERDSYNDPETAAFIDSHFVAVKVDYDADPKLSAEFERAHAFANLPAGLPLTAFLTPDGKLYSGGGYFPKKATADNPSFRQALEEASHMFRDQRETIEREGFQLKIGE
jgi:uncharacterized protein YyaL (SSP411 family)